MRGLDPRIHDAMPARNQDRYLLSRLILDCRVKPGNDAGQGVNSGSATSDLI